jgi:SAM-dependent methyltransferase
VRDVLEWLEGPLPFDEVGRDPQIDFGCGPGTLAMLVEAAHVYLFGCDAVPEQLCSGVGDVGCL